MPEHSELLKDVNTAREDCVSGSVYDRRKKEFRAHMLA